MKYLIILAISTSALMNHSYADINDIVLNEILFNPGNITPSTGQNCDGDGTVGEDGNSPVSYNAADEFIEFFNNGVTDVNIEGYCISNREITDSDTSVPTTSSWLIPDLTPDLTVPANGFLFICGDDGSGLGFSIVDAQGNQVEQFSNNSGANTWASLYEPTTAGDCSGAVESVIFSENYGDGESNGEPYLRCFTDGTSPLDFYRNDNGDFAVPTPGAANCTLSTPVYVNHIKHNGSSLEWQAGLEFNHIGYNVYSIVSQKPPEKINSAIIARNKSLNYRLDLPELYHNKKLLLTAIDIDGNEQKLDYIEDDQQYGEKDKAIAIDWQKQPLETSKVTNKSHLSENVTILVSQSGIQKIKVQNLLNMGFDIVGLSKNSLLLTDNEVPVPFYIKSKKSRIQATDSIMFIAKKAHSIYSDQRIYRLSKSRNLKLIKAIKAEPRRNIDFAKYFIDTKTIEENNSYEFTSPNDDPWIMKSLLAFTQSRSETWEVELPFLSEEQVSQFELITTTASINGVTDFHGVNDDHHIELLINNQSVSQYFDGQESIELVNSDYNKNITSPFEVTLNQPADTGYAYDLVNLDKFSISYPRSFVAESGRLDFNMSNQNFSVSGFDSKDVVIITESVQGTYLLDGARKREVNGTYAFDFYNRIKNSHVYLAQWDDIYQPMIRVNNKPEIKPLDYLIVTKNEFIPYLSDYVNQKQAQGLKTMVIDTESIYAHYGSIHNHPNSIKTYINELNRHYPLSYVMVVGSDQYDYKNHLNSDAYSIVPTFYRNTGSGINHAPTDVPYVDFNNDNTANIPIGRLMVNNIQELNNVLQKIQNFQNSFHDTELYISDNIDSENFVAMVEYLSGLSSNNLHHINAYDLGVEQANLDLINALNSGTDFVNWIGHSSASRWSRDNVFDIDDVNLLHNSPAVFFQLGCWNSYFVDPINQTLANSLLQKQNYGAVATIGSSTYTKTDGEKLLAQYYNEFINNNNQVTIGQALNYAFNKYAINNPDRKDILLGYQLLGDPTMLVK